MKNYILILFFFLPSITFAQRFNYAKIKTSSIDSLRKTDNGKFINYGFFTSVSPGYFPNSDQYSLAQPITYIQEDKNFDIGTSFYFSNKDSVVRLIEYQWEGLKDATFEQFAEIIRANRKAISSHFNSTPEEIPETIETAAKTIWQNDVVYVELLVMSMQQRTRVLVSWK